MAAQTVRYNVAGTVRVQSATLNFKAMVQLTHAPKRTRLLSR